MSVHFECGINIGPSRVRQAQHLAKEQDLVTHDMDRNGMIMHPKAAKVGSVTSDSRKQSVYRLQVDPIMKLYCSGDQLILLPTGSFKRADALTIGEHIQCADGVVLPLMLSASNPPSEGSMLLNIASNAPASNPLSGHIINAGGFAVADAVLNAHIEEAQLSEASDRI